MAYRPAVGQKYARLRAEQQAMLAAAGKALAEDMNQEHLAGAAAAVNAGRLNCQNIADAGHPALAGALESMAARSKRSTLDLDDRPSRSCGKDIGEWRQLEKIMEQAMQLQLAQLKNLRVRNASVDEASQSTLLDRAGASSACPADEEQPLKMSLDNIMETLKVARAALAAGRKALLQAVAGEVINAMTTTEVLSFSSTSALLRNATCGDGCLLLPCLDSAPSEPGDLRRFLQRVQAASVRSLSLPPEATSEMLKNQGQQLCALQRLELSSGQGCRLASIALPRLPCLEVLLVHCGPGGADGGLNVAGIGWLKELLESLPRRLKLLEIEALAVDVATATLQALFAEAAVRPQRLVLRSCVLPDSAVKCICEALPEIEVTWGSWSEPVVLLEDCHLSALAEEHLLQTLEKCCTVAVSLSGGSRHELSCDVPAWLEEIPGHGYFRGIFGFRFLSADAQASMPHLEGVYALPPPPPRSGGGIVLFIPGWLNIYATGLEAHLKA
eukprot:s3314_g4.t1